MAMHEPSRRRAPGRVPLLVLVAIAAVAVACGGGASPAPSSPAPSGSPAAGPITQAQAVEIVLAGDPRFAGIGPLDPDLIGQSAWYEVSPATVGWRVSITKGWGDCQAGCISRHTWVYDVAPDGTATLVAETGDPLEGGTGGDGGTGIVPATPPMPIPAEGGPFLAGLAVAGPTCPVEQNPPDPSCAERPVAGATVIVRDAAGTEVATALTGADGWFLVGLGTPGTYTVEAQPVEGLMGTPAPQGVVVGERGVATVTLAYDTGIR